MPTKIQLRRDNYINFGNAQTTLGSTPLLSSGEPAFDSGSRLRIGDGNLTFQKLPVYAPITHFSVLGADDTFGTTSNETIFGQSLVLGGEAYEVEYQLVGSFDSINTLLTVSIENFIDGTVTVENFVSEWTCHKNINTAGYGNLTNYGSLSSDANGSIVRDVGYGSTTRSSVIHNADNETGLYFFTYRVKGIIIPAGAVTFNPRFAYSNASHVGTLTLKAGSYIKVTTLGPTNTITRSGNWSA